MIKKPSFRKLRGYAFDPSMSINMDTAEINDIIYKIPWEDVGIEGYENFPVGEYLEIVDYDPTIKKYYEPLNLNDPYLLAQDGIDPSESNPLFHQQMVYAVTMLTIINFEKALGRKIIWSEKNNWEKDDQGKYIFKNVEYIQRLRIYPHALREPNAYYSPEKRAILYGYFNSRSTDESRMMPDSIVFTCLSHDVIAHETTHAILDGINNYFNHPTNPDMLAFHEAFADIVALFQHFSFKEVLKNQISKTKGDLNSQNLLGQLAQEFGSAIGSYGGLRDAIGKVNPDTNLWEPLKPNPSEYKTIMEPHARGSILVAAVFDAFLSIYKNRVADLIRIASDGSGELRKGELHPDLVNRLAAEAAKAASHVLRMCIRALDYCPPVDLTFGEYFRALITADIELLDDDKRDYRVAFIEAFRKRGIYPIDLKTLSIESLKFIELNIGFQQKGKKLELIGTNVLKSNSNKLITIIGSYLKDYASEIKFITDRKEIFDITNRFIWGDPLKKGEGSLYKRINMNFENQESFAEATGLSFIKDYNNFGIKHYVEDGVETNTPKFRIQNLRFVSCVGPDGKLLNQVIFSIVQTAHILYDDNYNFVSAIQSVNTVDYQTKKNHYRFMGGCTLIFNLDTLELKYSISKPILKFDSNNGPSLNISKINKELKYRIRDGYYMQNDFNNYFGSSPENEPFAFLHQH